MSVLIIDDIELKINKLKKKKFGYGAPYCTKIIADYLGLDLSIDEIINCFDNYAKLTGAEHFTMLENLGLEPSYYTSINKAFELLSNEQPLIYFDYTNKSCGVIYGFTKKKFRIFDLKKERKVKHEWFNRLDGFIQLSLKED